MASVPIGQICAPPAGHMLLCCVREQGTASHPHPSGGELLDGPSSRRNLADAIHFLCALHGRHPGLIELVAARTVDPAARAWLREATDAFGGERAFLARLAVEAGPVPATPGGGGEAVISMQRNAIMTLAQSERRGCALGAALALAADWAAIRRVLDCAASRFGVTAPPPWPSDLDALAALADTLGDSAPVRRALLFAAEQVALQHRGLWDLLRARALAREGR